MEQPRKGPPVVPKRPLRALGPPVCPPPAVSAEELRRLTANEAPRPTISHPPRAPLAADISPDAVASSLATVVSGQGTPLAPPPQGAGQAAVILAPAVVESLSQS